MAEASLKLGGDWATKEGSLLGFNDQNGNYKPIPFDFTRATTATRVNRDGLIEEVQAGVPRIDFLDNPDGALKLEPQRTNLLNYSEDFTSWTKLNGGTGILPVVTSNQTISPDGTQNADKIVFNKGAATSNSDYSLLRLDYGGVDIDGFASIYLKADSNVDIEISPDDVNYQTVSVTTEWQRFSVNDATSDRLSMGLRGTTPITTSATIYAWGAQLEAGSYPTSYIKTSGSAVTRNADSASNLNSFFNGLTNMAWFIDYTIPTESSSGFRNQFGYRDNSEADFYMIQLPSGNTHEFRYRGVTGVNVDMTPSIDEATYGLRRKIAYTKNGTTLKVFCNGAEVSSVTNANATTFSTNNEYLQFSSSINNEMGVNKTLLFPTALSDEEAIALTTI